MASTPAPRRAFTPTLFRWHRWLGWIVGLQVLAWLMGGLLFTWLPFKDWVKAEALVQRPALQLLPQWAASIAAQGAALEAGPIVGLSAVATAQGPALRLRRADGDTWLRLDGLPFEAPDAAAIERYARSLYKGGEVGLAVTRQAQVPVRAFIVRETAGRGDLWLASFDDALNTRLYFNAGSGELIAVRNDAWVLYDFFWRLHLMDYGEGEDFSHPLVKVASLLAFVLVGTGAALSVVAARRAWRQRSRRREASQTA